MQAILTTSRAEQQRALLDPAERVVMYVRMSTEHQQYSPENQADAIRHYAARHGWDIVRTYADHGRSGLHLGGRPGLQRLLRDVEDGRADFSAILVYDVSRWGRFQDPDESASYELLCRRHGIAVHYCAEPFENDGTLASSIIKGVKRSMAAEYSRELGIKVFAGQTRQVALGHRMGGPAGFGLRRLLLDQAGKARAVLEHGQHKCIQSDRIVLVPGPDNEVQIVRWAFEQFVQHERHAGDIADDLNARGIRDDLGQTWLRQKVIRLLQNEKYVGHNVWNRFSFRLGILKVRNPPESWVRADNVFQPIISQALFDQAQACFRKRRERPTDEALLQPVRALLAARGRLSARLLEGTDGCPSPKALAWRFGSLRRTFALAGYYPVRSTHDEVRVRLARMLPGLVGEICTRLRAVGASVEAFEAVEPHRRVLVNGELSLAFRLCRCRMKRSRYWLLYMPKVGLPHADLTVLMRMDASNEAVLDYYLLPASTLPTKCLLLHVRNEDGLDVYRHDTLDCLYDLVRRIPLKEVQP